MLWNKTKKQLAACFEINEGLAKVVAEQSSIIGQYKDVVARLFKLTEETEELRERVEFQERIDECLRLELRLVKANLLMRDLKPDISALERLYLFDDPRS
jgi:hypothetical protein